MGFFMCFGRLIGAVMEVEVAGRGAREGVSKKVRCAKGRQTDIRLQRKAKEKLQTEQVRQPLALG